jgi:hypothetical protein
VEKIDLQFWKFAQNGVAPLVHLQRADPAELAARQSLLCGICTYSVCIPLYANMGKTPPKLLEQIHSRQYTVGMRSNARSVTILVAIADLSAIPQLSAVSCQFRYFPVAFPQLRMVLKITKNIF